MSAPDVESVQPASRQRSRCLDVFLLSSVIALIIMVLSGAAIGFYFITKLQSEMEKFTHVPGVINSALQSKQSPPDLSRAYQMQNFAYFTPKYSEVKNGSMEWVSLSYKTSTTVGSRFSYDSDQHVLKMHQEGTYFLYTQLKLSCTGICPHGTISITFEDNNNAKLLTCSVQYLFPETSVKKCWTVIPYLSADRRVIVKMYTSVPPETSLSLDLNDSGFGIFLVD